MFCSSCGSANPDDASFCKACGARQAASCGACGVSNPPDARFCAGCGEELGDKPRASRRPGERRQVSVVLVDLVGWTALAQRLDPEDLRDCLDAYQRAVGAAITAGDGHVARLLGDGVLAYFGYPIAREDDVARAIRAGLDAVERVSAIEVHGHRPRVRVGIHTGDVVIQDMEVHGHVESLAVGQTPKYAELVQRAADVNTVLVSEATRKLAGGYFVFEPMPIRELGEVERAARLFRVVAESSANSRLEAAGGLSPFVGRSAELERLMYRYDRVARDGAPAFVELSGEAGIGKSRLVHEVLSRVAARGGRAVRAQCSPYLATAPLHPLVDLIEREAGLLDDAGTEAKAAKLSRWVERHSDDPDALSLLSELFELPVENELAMIPAKRRSRMFEVLAQVVRAMGEGGPFVFLVEDVHWADASTLELLGALSATGGEGPMLTLVTYRPELTSVWQNVDLRLELTPLDLSEAGDLVGQVTGGKALPAEVMDLVLSRTGGVPLFIEEVTKALLEHESLVEGEGGWRVDGELPLELIPSSVKAALGARMDRLGPVRGIAQLASVLGREFSYSMIAAVHRGGEDQLRRALLALEEAELLFRQSTPPRSTYLFKHALVRDAAYESMLRRARREHHAHIAQTIRESFPGIAEARPELLAEHFEGAEMWPEALSEWCRAGRRELARAANQEAIDALEKALACHARLPDPAADKPAEMEIHLGLMSANMAIKGWAHVDVEAACLRARALAEELGDHQTAFGATWGLWTVHFLRGDLGAALEVADGILATATAAESPMLLSIGNQARGYTRYFQGHMEDALAHASAGLAHFDLEIERQITELFQLSVSVNLHSFEAAALWHVGRPESAKASLARAQKLAKELDHLPTTATLLGFTCQSIHPWRDHAWSLKVAEDTISLSQREGYLLWVPVCLVFLGYERFELGRQEEGLETTKAAIDTLLAFNSRLILTESWGLYADMLRRAGRAAEAVPILEHAMAAARERQEMLFAPELWRFRALCREEAGDAEGALADLEAAADLALEQGAVMFEIRALTRATRLAGGSSAFADRLRARLDGLTEAQGAPDVIDARAELGR